MFWHTTILQHSPTEMRGAALADAVVRRPEFLSRDNEVLKTKIKCLDKIWLKRVKTDHITLSSGSQSHKEFRTRQTRSAMNVTHLSTSATLSLVQGFPLLIPSLFSSSTAFGEWPPFYPLKPVLNWANVSSRTWSAVFGEACWFLIGRTFLREPSWKYSANLVGSIRRTATKLYSGYKKARSTCSGNIRPIGRSLPLIGWEQSSPVNEEKIKIKMDDGVARFFTRFRGNLFICWLVGGAALSRRPRMR